MIKDPKTLREIFRELEKINPKINDYCCPEFALFAATKNTVFREVSKTENGEKVLWFLVENEKNKEKFFITWETVAENVVTLFGQPEFSADTFIYAYLSLVKNPDDKFMSDFLEEFKKNIVSDNKPIEKVSQNDRVYVECLSNKAGFESSFSAPQEWSEFVLGVFRQTNWSIPWISSVSSFLRNQVAVDLAASSNLMSCPAEMYPFSVYKIDANEILAKSSQTLSIDAVMMNTLVFISETNMENKIVFIDNANNFSEAVNGALFLKIKNFADQLGINLMFGGEQEHPDCVSPYCTNIFLDIENLGGEKEICHELCRIAKANLGIDCFDHIDYILESIPDKNSKDFIENLVRLIDHIASSYRNKKTNIRNIVVKEGESGAEAYAKYIEKCQKKIFKVSRSHVKTCMENVYQKQSGQIGAEKALVDLNVNLKKLVFGQDEAIDRIHNTLVRSKANLRQRKGPLGIFLFLGASGTGKTYLAKKTQKMIYGDEQIIRLDMSEYADQTSVNKIFGASAGYVGYDDGSNFLKEVSEKPRSVVLLDEIEKAHPQVLNSFLHIFDEGKAKTAKGEVIDFSQTIIIVTGNVGSTELQAVKKRSMGFNDSQSQEEFESSKRDQAISAIKSYFRPEFLNRISDIVVFNNLTDKEIASIVRSELKEIQQGCRLRNIKFTFDDNVVNFLVKKSVDPLHNGARLVAKVVRDHVETPLAMTILKSNPSKISVCVENDSLKQISSKSVGKRKSHGNIIHDQRTE